jgi:hypothetical protein
MNGLCDPVLVKGYILKPLAERGMHHNWSRRDPSCVKGSAGERAHDSGCRGCEAPPLVREIHEKQEDLC